MAGRHVKGMRAASDFGFLVVIAGAVLLVGGAITYVVVSTTLGEQEITVSDDADAFAGQKVTQPWRPYAQANAIADRATKVAGGKMYSELPQDDPNRQTVMICFVPAGVTVHLGRRLWRRRAGGGPGRRVHPDRSRVACHRGHDASRRRVPGDGRPSGPFGLTLPSDCPS